MEPPTHSLPPRRSGKAHAVRFSKSNLQIRDAHADLSLLFAICGIKSTKTMPE